MRNVWAVGGISALVLALAACGDGSKPPAAPTSPPIHTACTTPEQAGQKATDVTKKLAEAVTAKRMSEDDYRVHNATLRAGLRAWGEKRDLKAYCAALEKIVNDAALQ